MNAKEDMNSTGDCIPMSKKRKKHKHKKHRKKKIGSEDYFGSSSPEDGNIIIDVSDFPVVQLTPSSSTGSAVSTPDVKSGISPKNPKKKNSKAKAGNDSETSEEEQRWLDAIQEGKLEEVEPELKNMKTKDPKLMTARQRAMLIRKGDPAVEQEPQELISLPSGYKEKVMTPEMIKKAEANKEKMRKLHDEKRAKEKKRTLERLLRKQEAKGTKGNSKKAAKKLGLTIKLISNISETYMMLPIGIDYPLAAQVATPLPARLKCGVHGCSNDKRYACSKTGVPLCSLNCYKKNLAMHGGSVAQRVP